MNLNNKRLLILGGPALAIDIVKTAQQLGVYTMVTDWYDPEKMPAKTVADEYFMVSNADVDAVTQLIKEQNIEGVLTGFTDSTLPHYQKICEKAGLPCYATKEQIEITCNKRKFKDLCHQHSVPVVEEYEVNSSKDVYQLTQVKYPVIVKPVDNSGAKGISICKDSAELVIGVKRALDFSQSKKVIVERYMQGKEVTIFYILHNGEIFLSAMGDRHTKKNQLGVIPLPVAYTFPSIHLSKYQKKLNSKVIDMFKSIGMKNGMVFIQSFVEGDNCVFYEMGYRLTGSLEHKLINKINGYDPMEMMIRYALTGIMTELKLTKMVNPNFMIPACNITFLAKPGRIASISGIKEILALDEVEYALPSYKEGDIIPETAKGTLQQVVLRVFAVGKSKSTLAKVIDKIHKLYKVFSDKGENMLLEPFNTNEYLAND